ncbi:hypothetical protein E6C27_scaffold465G00200 [Cucumis melo var. makuwa]|uniref:Flocculation protein FLO11-like n=1 Tax=Cucumis melo var. makuwa TaxID=1194695 RepID=A0A5A7SNA1_CUCMM|nr:hypothetical protein E6C27_scaffold465G00200 [Cucumis melo var. makuwa]
MPHSVAPSTADPSLNVPPNDGFIDNDKLDPPMSSTIPSSDDRLDSGTLDVPMVCAVPTSVVPSSGATVPPSIPKVSCHPSDKEPKTMALSFRLFQGTDVPDLSSSFFPSQGGSRSSSSNVPLSFDNLLVMRDLIDRRSMVDLLFHDLQGLIAFSGADASAPPS